MQNRGPLKVFILAYSLHEAEDMAAKRELRPDAWLWLNSPWQLAGLYNFTIWICQNWPFLKDWQKIIEKTVERGGVLMRGEESVSIAILERYFQDYFRRYPTL